MSLLIPHKPVSNLNVTGTLISRFRLDWKEIFSIDLENVLFAPSTLLYYYFVSRDWHGP